MRTIRLAVIHCSATPRSMDIGAKEIRLWHVDLNGWSDIGYHYIIRLDGTVEYGRPIERIGAHVKGRNKDSIGIVYVGGVDEDLNPMDTRTECQKEQLVALLKMLKKDHPGIEIMGHRDLSPDLDGDGEIEEHEWLKDCPSFDAKSEYAYI